MPEEVWFVTGSSRGLGRSVVEAALEAGYPVAATARSTASLDGLAAEYGEQLELITLDVTDPDRAVSAIDRCVERFGRVDVVVNNAGYADLAPIEEVSLYDFRDQVDAVFYGTVHVTKAALPQFRRQGSGFFIQVASIGGRTTAPGLGAYQSAKFAVEGFSGVLRQEVAPLNIRVTVAEPGAMRTDWAGSSMSVAEFDPVYDQTVGVMAERLRQSSGHQPIDPDAVARVLVNLAGNPNPPLHLVLGSDAVRHAQSVLEATAADDREWADVGRSVDYGAGND